MNREEFFNYIIENFNVSGEYGRLLNNVLIYAENKSFTRRGLHNYLKDMLSGTIGLTDKEIKMAAF